MTGTRRGNAKAATARGIPFSQLKPAPLVLLSGGEEVLAERAIELLVTTLHAVDPELVTRDLLGASYEAGQLEEFTSPSLFGGRSLIIVRGMESAATAFGTDLADYLAHPSPDCDLVLQHGGGVKGKALLEQVRSAGAIEVNCQPVTRDDLKAELAAEEFSAKGCQAPTPVIRALVEAAGNDLRELLSACRQLAEQAILRDAAKPKVTLADVGVRFAGRVEVTAFRVADAAVAGQGEAALSLLRHALATGCDPIPLIAALAMKVRTLAKVSAAGRGRSAELAPALGLAPWQIDRARKDLAGWNERSLRAAILALAQADETAKGGGRDPVYAIERAVLTIAAARD